MMQADSDALAELIEMERAPQGGHRVGLLGASHWPGSDLPHAPNNASAGRMSARLPGIVPPTRQVPHGVLSSREMEVLLLLAKGFSLARIGEQLGLSVKTVTTYRGRILVKLNVFSNAELSRYVQQHNLG